jgi:hypothetical protein
MSFMRKAFLLLAFAIFTLAGTAVKAGGGPDVYGYTWLASTDAGGPTYNWVDISGKAGVVTVSGLADDNSKGPYAMGWDFHYYWSDWNEVKIGSNGWVGFNNIGNIAHCFPTVPTAGGAGDNFLAPYMSDLCMSCGGAGISVQYWSNNVDSFVVTYNNVPWWSTTAPGYVGSNTFQVILDGTDSSITFQYNTIDPYVDNASCASDLEIGIENITGNIGLECYTETSLPDGFAIKFYYPDVVTFTVPDATPAWNGNSANKGQFILVPSVFDPTTNIANVGNADVSTPITIDGEIRGLSPTDIQWTGTSSLATGVAYGTNTTVTFPTSWNAATAGQYYYQVDIASSSDINPSNNSNTIELSAVAAGATTSLTYSTGNPPDGALSWAGGGNDGCAIQIVSPFLSTDVLSAEFFILDWDGDAGTPSARGFDVKVYDDDGTGNPGAMIDSATVIAGDVVENDWNVVDLADVTTTTPTFYVAWLQHGDSVALGTEAFGPISRRTYEILSGAWASYRESTVSDFLIRVNVSGLVSTDEAAVAPALQLMAYPNPATSQATIAYQIENAGDITLSVTNIYGQTVFSRNHNNLTPGLYNTALNTAELAGGVYFITVTNGAEKVTEKLVVNK